jgi:hypothetical protein
VKEEEEEEEEEEDLFNRASCEAPHYAFFSSLPHLPPS